MAMVGAGHEKWAAFVETGRSIRAIKRAAGRPMWLPILVASHRPCQLYKNSWWSFWFGHPRAVIHSVAPKKEEEDSPRSESWWLIRTVLIDLLVAIRRVCAVLWNSTRVLIIMGAKRPDFNVPTPKSNRRRKSETKSHFFLILYWRHLFQGK